MAAESTGSGGLAPAAALVVRKTIRATAARLFDAWTSPAQIKQWWGPESVVCVDAEIDLRVGGRYRIANRMPDGRILWIAGVFELIEAPYKLVYTWALEPIARPCERVTVQFRPQGESTEVIVTHENVPSASMREGHALGWQGCLAGLAQFLQSGAGGVA
jgi:uncharacterized protein YndB with AHSA1/START domain